MPWDQNQQIRVEGYNMHETLFSALLDNFERPSFHTATHLQPEVFRLEAKSTLKEFVDEVLAHCTPTDTRDILALHN